MTKVYDYILPTVAVFLVATSMHIVRVQHLEAGFILSFMLFFTIGMATGALFYSLKEESTSR